MKDLQGMVLFAFGPQPLDFFQKAQSMLGKDSVICPDVARMAGANFAIGEPNALNKFQQILAAGALQSQQAETPRLSEQAIKWLATGRRGLSSETMFSVITGHDCTRGHGINHPHDPDDLDRCLKLLDQVPELRQGMGKLLTASKNWQALLLRWDEIETSHLNEVGLGWTKSKTAPKTFALMQSILESV